MNSMQEQTTTLENKILSLMSKYEQAEGYLQEVIWYSIESRYQTYYSYTRNLPNVITPHYQRISGWVSQRSVYWREKLRSNEEG